MSVQVYSLTAPTVGPLNSNNDERFVSVAYESLTYWSSRLLGCWHREMSRPFTRGGRTYRTCARCGMHREFDLQNWKTKGRFYQEPVGKAKHNKSPVRSIS